MHKMYKVAEDGETPTVKLNFNMDKSSGLYPKTDKAATPS